MERDWLRLDGAALEPSQKLVALEVFADEDNLAQAFAFFPGTAAGDFHHAMNGLKDRFIGLAGDAENALAAIEPVAVVLNQLAEPGVEAGFVDVTAQDAAN